jgi:Ca2+-binding EF-hand superfamily protein
MKKLSIYAGLIAFSLTSAAALYAAPGNADPDGNHVVTKPEAMAATDARFAKMDANGDGTLNAADRTAMIAKHFTKMDSNGDGSISQSEFMTMHEAGAERRTERREKRMEHIGAAMHEGRNGGRRVGGAMPMLARVDTNGDKAVSQAEFRAAIEARFSNADTNQDGSVTMEERQAARNILR